MLQADSRTALFRVIAVLLLTVPVVPVALGWVAALRSGGEPAWRRRVQLVLLVLQTVSAAMLLTQLFTDVVIGSHFTDRRFATMWVNLVAMATAALVAIPFGGRARLALVTAGAWLSCAWFYVVVVSSVL